MHLDFDTGNPTSPRGHAIIYFRARYDAEKLVATYAITLPMAIDFSKYVPPFLASHLAAEPLKDLSAFSLPPVPEEVESYDQLKRLSEARADDLVCGGTVATNDLPEMMQVAGDAVQEYARLWNESQPAAGTGAIPELAQRYLGHLTGRQRGALRPDERWRPVAGVVQAGGATAVCVRRQ